MSMCTFFLFSLMGGMTPTKILVLPFQVSPDLPQEAGIGVVLGIYDHLYDYEALVPVGEYLNNLEKHGIFSGTPYPRAKLQSVFGEVGIRVWGAVNRDGTEIWVEDMRQSEITRLFLPLSPEDPGFFAGVLGLFGFEAANGQHGLAFYTKLAAPLFVQDPTFSGRMYGSLVREHQTSAFVFWVFDHYAPPMDPNQVDTSETAFWRDYFMQHKDFFSAYQFSDVILQRNVSGPDYAQHAKILTHFKQIDEAERYKRMAMAYGYVFPSQVEPSTTSGSVK